LVVAPGFGTAHLRDSQQFSDFFSEAYVFSRQRLTSETRPPAAAGILGRHVKTSSRHEFLRRKRRLK
jgi:hypothetical protein